MIHQDLFGEPGVPRILALAIEGRRRGMPTLFSTDGKTNHVYAPPNLASVHTIHWQRLCYREAGAPAPDNRLLVAEPYYWLERYGIAPETCLICRSLLGTVLRAARRRRPRSSIAPP
jgi:hypothetical protein